MGGRVCVAMQGNGRHEFVLWQLTPDLDWERRFVLRHATPRSSPSKRWFIGAWDCGDQLLVWFRGAGLRVYDLRKKASYGGDAHRPAGRWTLEDHRSKTGEDLGHDEYQPCWGYQPTLVSPRSVLGGGTGGEHVFRCFQSGRRAPERPTVRFVEVLSSVVRRLLDGEEVVDTGYE